MNEEKKYELIEKFLNKELTPAEEQELRELRDSDPNFESEVDNVRISMQALEALPLLDFSDKIKAAEKDYLDGRRKTNLWKCGLIGVLAIGLVAGTSYYLSGDEAGADVDQEVVPVDETSEVAPSVEPKVEAPIVVVHVDHEGNAVKVLEPSTIESHEVLDTVYHHKKDAASDEITIIEKPVGLVIHDTTPVVQYVHEEPAVETDDPFVCPDIVFSQEVERPCENQDNGIIRVTNISGGVGPYKVRLDDESFVSDRAFTALFAGDYEVTIQDAKECTVQLMVSLDEKECKTSFVYSPNYEEHWEIPSPSDIYTFTLLSEYGSVLYKKEYADEDNVWDGKNFDGEVIQQGVYIFLIEYEGKVKKGELSIVFE